MSVRHALAVLLAFALSGPAVAASKATRVKQLRAGGAIVLGYLDVGTIEPYRSWFKAAKPYRLDYWPDWGEWYANVARPGYRQLLAGRVPGLG